MLTVHPGTSVLFSQSVLFLQREIVIMDETYCLDVDGWYFVEVILGMAAFRFLDAYRILRHSVNVEESNNGKRPILEEKVKNECAFP